ncbi:uncharacterized protein DEA37_0013097 [Paragonimus westermani]|uniref:Uncharacterized protein n=1 Tax=Paragonimus westermani TaxID=34504 RepID=A0A5J4NF17_9TREM|nr:uncharacterized protein DEA37_0013097 [Paragonimus westermani]
MAEFGSHPQGPDDVSMPTARTFLLYSGACHAVFSSITLLVCSSYYALSSELFETQFEERIASDVITIIACLAVFLPVSESTTLLLKLVGLDTLNAILTERFCYKTCTVHRRDFIDCRDFNGSNKNGINCGFILDR